MVRAPYHHESNDKQLDICFLVKNLKRQTKAEVECDILYAGYAINFNRSYCECFFNKKNFKKWFNVTLRCQLYAVLPH